MNDQQRTGHAHAQELIDRAKELVCQARALGFAVKIDHASFPPLAMGQYAARIEVYPVWDAEAKAELSEVIAAEKRGEKLDFVRPRREIFVGPDLNQKDEPHECLISETIEGLAEFYKDARKGNI